MLETEIKKLTKAIETLTAVMEAQGVAVEQPKAEEQLEQPKAEEPKAEPTVTHDEVKDLCLKISRADRLKKPAIKAGFCLFHIWLLYSLRLCDLLHSRQYSVFHHLLFGDDVNSVNNTWEIAKNS